LTINDAIELFRKHYSTDEIDSVEQIVKYLDYHALFIELLATTYKRMRAILLNEIIRTIGKGRAKVRIEVYRMENRG